MISFITEKQSCWERLKAEKRPIFIYGMGDGALKIMKVFKQMNITLSGIFASDDFVRGHSFEGYRVHKLSEIEEAVNDFVVVLAFAAGYQEIVDKIHAIAAKHTLYVPDVPVIGGGLFTYDYCVENQEKIAEVYAELADDYSRKVYANIINFKISGKIECSLRIDSKKQAAAELNLNKELANQVIQSLQWIKVQAGEGEINLTDVLRYPGVVGEDWMVGRLSGAFEGLGYEFFLDSASAARVCDPNDERVDLLTNLVNEELGTSLEPYAMGGATHARWIPGALGFGPGRQRDQVLPAGVGSGHEVNEAVNIEHLKQAILIYLRAILALDKQ